MSVNRIKDFTFENYYKRIAFSKENSLYSIKHLKRKDLLLLANKLTEKVPDSFNAKQHSESFIRKKNRKLVKQSAIITYQPKTFKSPNIFDVKSVITEHPKTSHKLAKTRGKGEKLDSNIPLYSDSKKRENFLNGKHIKIKKVEHALKASQEFVMLKFLILLTLNYKLDSESAIKSKLIELLTHIIINRL